MEENKLSIEVPRRSIIYLLICVAGVLAFVLGGIYPSYRNVVRLDDSIAALKAQIEEQKVLFPLYQKLRASLGPDASKAQLSPQKSALSARRIDDLPPIFGEIAAKCGLDLSEVTPDVKSMADDSHFLSVDLTLQGNFFNLRKFLLEVASLPYMGPVEKLQIQEGSHGKEYFLKVWLLIDNSRPSAG